jgi:hypothetical protein
MDKATPAFNKELCEMLNVNVLSLTGKNDSVFQEFDQTGKQVLWSIWKITGPLMKYLCLICSINATTLSQNN